MAVTSDLAYAYPGGLIHNITQCSRSPCQPGPAHRPGERGFGTVTITEPRGNAVLVGEDAWRAIQETLYLQSIPGMSESLRKARDEGIDAASPYLR
ncbi:type II toxin-antitoxin system Phd/YefM family antitoxin [Corynebacterium pyruviciproducens]